eukprot:TRINITY_DN2495_c0_g2_i2.p1 TRINITY_DN2495_c0_g2~~TRINITY_DN2495_c0_g2_i2.p1  ORF type:complete len:137 (+),score=5.11 TRINITY_DN2495_c0_g2_i2:72-482(+)
MRVCGYEGGRKSSDSTNAQEHADACKNKTRPEESTAAIRLEPRLLCTYHHRHTPVAHLTTTQRHLFALVSLDQRTAPHSASSGSSFTTNTEHFALCRQCSELLPITMRSIHPAPRRPITSTSISRLTTSLLCTAHR